jgi:hypothetical protein
MYHLSIIHATVSLRFLFYQFGQNLVKILVSLSGCQPSLATLLSFTIFALGKLYYDSLILHTHTKFGKWTSTSYPKQPHNEVVHLEAAWMWNRIGKWVHVDCVTLTYAVLYISLVHSLNRACIMGNISLPLKMSRRIYFFSWRREK